MLCPDSGKVIYYQKSKAEAGLRSLQDRFEYTGRVYPCPYCRGFHLGREKVKAHKNKFKA